MVKAKNINTRCVILGFGAVVIPVCHIFATRYSMNEYLLVDKNRITDEQIKYSETKKYQDLKLI